MSRPLRFILVLIFGLALLAWAAFHVVNNLTQTWFERDISLRAQLAVHGANQSLVAYWNESDRNGIARILHDITRDERIMAAAACSLDNQLMASTEAFPDEVSCAELAGRARSTADGQSPQWRAVGMRQKLPGGSAFVSAVPLVSEAKPIGFVILVHDMGFVDRRGAQIRQLILVAFLVLAAAASLFTFAAFHLLRRGWLAEIRHFLRGRPRDRAGQREFQPILTDVRELIEQISAERALDEEGSGWTPQRLKGTLTRYLHGERIFVLANREPYIHDRAPDGSVRVLHPASGLVTAMEPVMRACGGVWIAHGSGTADRAVVDKHSRIAVPPGEGTYLLRRVWLTAEQEQGYYYGFANEGLWPLCHIAHTRPVFRGEDWRHYQEVNRLFAEAVCEEADSDDPIVLIQDYHFAVAPRMIRERLPRATIISFWHIPWPNAERLGICPWAEDLLNGMLGSSILGFHTQLHCNNFLEAAGRFLEARIDREQNAVVQHGRGTLVRPYPISIEWPNHWVEQSPPVAECRRAVIDQLGLSPDALIGMGVDRLDYTKGVEERLWAVERLLEKRPDLRGRFTFVQLAAPSRTVIERYRQLNENVEREAARINERFSSNGYRPIILLREHHEPPTVFRLYRAADVCYVSSLHDGMNLVAKEFIAARDDERGVLVLSHFTGASRELTEALVVNPYDLDEASAALSAALEMPSDEQQTRMRAMRSLIAQFNVYRWAGRMLIDAAQLRTRERMWGRLSDHSD